MYEIYIYYLLYRSAVIAYSPVLAFTILCITQQYLLQPARVDKWHSKQRSKLIRCYDEKMRFYKNIIERMDTMSRHSFINCIELRIDSFLTSVKTHAREWLHLCGSYIMQRACQHLSSINSYITVSTQTQDTVSQGLSSIPLTLLYLDLNQEKFNHLLLEPNTMEELKFVLHHIDEIRKTSVDREYEIRHMLEMYRTLSNYGVPVNQFPGVGSVWVWAV